MCDLDTFVVVVVVVVVVVLLLFCFVLFCFILILGGFVCLLVYSFFQFLLFLTP